MNDAAIACPPLPAMHAPTGTVTSGAFPLAQASEGDWVRICFFRAGQGLEMRLTSMGLNLGSELRVSQRIGGNLVVLRGETRLALGAGMAQKILVERFDP